jgi:multiple sugar transport system permease protein
MNCLIAITTNLAGLLVIYSFLAFTLARLRWHERGIVAVLAAIVIAGQFWLAPALILRHSSAASLGSYSLSFCNWLISGFAVLILCHAVRWIPRQLEDSARLDGCSWFGIYWYVLLPLVRRELCLIGFLTLMGTSVLLLTPLFVFEGGFLTQWLVWLLPFWPGVLTLAQTIGLIMGASLVATLPVMVVFLFAKGGLLKDKESAG